MNNQQLRSWLKRQYPSALWSKKVDRMEDMQVFAVYSRIQRDKVQVKTVVEEESFEQLRLF